MSSVPGRQKRTMRGYLVWQVCQSLCVLRLCLCGCACGPAKKFNKNFPFFGGGFRRAFLPGPSRVRVCCLSLSLFLSSLLSLSLSPASLMPSRILTTSRPYVDFSSHLSFSASHHIVVHRNCHQLPVAPSSQDSKHSSRNNFLRIPYVLVLTM